MLTLLALRHSRFSPAELSCAASAASASPSLSHRDRHVDKIGGERDAAGIERRPRSETAEGAAPAAQRSGAREMV